MSKVAIITGGSRGIGKGIALKLAEMGYHIVVNYVSDSSKVKAEKVIQEAQERFSVDGLVVQADVADYMNCKKIVDATVEKFGKKIEVLVNNAGVEESGSFLDRKPEEYTRVMNINLLSPMHCSHLVLPHMIENKGGNIINISSIAAYMGMPTDIDYAASKSGLRGLTRSLAVLGASHNIRVNAIAPGAIKTDMVEAVPAEVLEQFIQTIPLKKMGEVEDIANCLEYIINAKFLTGQSISPNGGVLLD